MQQKVPLCMPLKSWSLTPVMLKRMPRRFTHYSVDHIAPSISHALSAMIVSFSMIDEYQWSNYFFCTLFCMIYIINNRRSRSNTNTIYCNNLLNSRKTFFAYMWRITTNQLCAVLYDIDDTILNFNCLIKLIENVFDLFNGMPNGTFRCIQTYFR